MDTSKKNSNDDQFTKVDVTKYPQEKEGAGFIFLLTNKEHCYG